MQSGSQEATLGSNHRGDQSRYVGRRSTSLAAEVETADDTPKRAVLACTRCRGHKVRCTGGDPCDRCMKARRTCTRQAHIRQNRRRTSEAPRQGSLRVDTSVRASLLSDHTSAAARDTMLEGASSAGSRCHDGYGLDIEDQLPIDPVSGTCALLNAISSSSRIWQHTPDQNGRNDAPTGPEPQQRLAMAISGPEAPFKPLVYRPAAWNNQEESALNSPVLGAMADQDSMWGGRSSGRSLADPVNTGIIDLNTCRVLYDFYVEHCHPFLPIVDIWRAEAFEHVRHSPILTSSITAIALRFYQGYTDRITGADPDGLTFSRTSLPDRSLPSVLAKLAEDHLADVLLHKRHTLLDVQAILLLAAWGLRSGGEGPDAWIVSGHASRVGMRLGLHQLEAKTMRVQCMGDENQLRKSDKIEAITREWRTWLCWSWFDGFISLGFGRPATGQFGSVEDPAFLLNRQTGTGAGVPSSTSHGDLLIVAQIRLAQLARDASERASHLASHSGSAVTGLELYTATLSPAGSIAELTGMLIDLNASLDDWYKLWIWAGAPYGPSLAGSSNIVRLQAEHVRLCLNSHALVNTPVDVASLSKYLQKAIDAAIAIIQIHSDSSQTGLSLSFAPDYVTLCLPQAALFLIKIYKAPVVAQAEVNLDKTVIAHYLTMTINILASSEISSTGLSTHLSNTVRAIAKVAGVTLPSGLAGPDQQSQNAADLAEFQSLFASASDEGAEVNQNSMFDFQNLFGDQSTLQTGSQEDAYTASGHVVDFSWLIGEGWNQQSA